jgi:hypothetical protein
MNAPVRKMGIRLGLMIAGAAFIALPHAAPAQEPAQTAPVGDVDARLRKLEELNAKLEKQNEKLAEQNDKLEKQNQVIQAASPAVAPDAAKSDGTKPAAEPAPKEEADGGGYVVGSDPVFKVLYFPRFPHSSDALRNLRTGLSGKARAA